MDRSRDPNPSPKLTGVLSIVIPQTYGDTATTTRRLPCLLRWGDDSFTRQRVLVGDSFDDEERGDDLFNPPVTLDNLFEYPGLTVRERT